MTHLDPNLRIEQLANPFRPGNGVRPPFLAGRDELLFEFERFLAEPSPTHANWTLTGIRGTGKTVLLGEFAARGERAGWLSLDRELGERHRDDLRLAEAISADCAALVRRCDTVAAIGSVALADEEAIARGGLGVAQDGGYERPPLAGDGLGPVAVIEHARSPLPD